MPLESTPQPLDGSTWAKATDITHFIVALDLDGGNVAFADAMSKGSTAGAAISGLRMKRPISTGIRPAAIAGQKTNVNFG